MYDLGFRIKMLREQRGLTQAALARRINKSKSAVASYESERQMPPLEVLISIAIVFNVSLDYLVGFERTQNMHTGLDELQIKLLDMIESEFYSPSGNGDAFSSRQIEILKNLILVLQRCNTSQITVDRKS